jgi:hypothetical protein
MTTSLLLADWGRVAQLGTIDVDAMTGDIVPLTVEQIAAIQERANELAERLTLETAPSG